ncbi:MAG: hypothetical protein Q7T16_06265 [Candidatus Burarchaeum sp.]|nr:hypothetical protein [Candidatus Burarchaeum sp.]MDO8340233.1 hypothetical protein [Candidatus Burarchaeum sp.]
MAGAQPQGRFKLRIYARLHEYLVKKLATYCDIVGGPKGPDYWARTTITAGLAGFVLGFLLVLVLMGNVFYALAAGPVIGFFAGYAVTTFPQTAAHNKVDAIERSLPLFLSHLVSTYASRKNMRDALIMSTHIDYGQLTPELLSAMRIYEATSDVGQAFFRLKNLGNRYISRTFDIISFSIESGVDIGKTLNMMTSDIQQTMQARDDKNSRTGLSVWMVFASSALFYPLFAGVGFTILAILENLLGATLYSANDKGLLLFTLLCYMVIAVCLDAVYIGQVRYGSVKKGIVRFLPFMLGVAAAVFIISMTVLQTVLIG